MLSLILALNSKMQLTKKLGIATIMKDFNAKVKKSRVKSITGESVLVLWSERGDRLIQFYHYLLLLSIQFLFYHYLLSIQFKLPSLNYTSFLDERFDHQVIILGMKKYNKLSTIIFLFYSKFLPLPSEKDKSY